MYKVLLVEDEPLEQRLYQNLFLKSGFEVVSVANGLDCHDKALEVKPDIVLLDVMMPEMNGFAALDVLQFDPLTKKIPVIIFTNLSDPQYQDEARRRGAVKFIIKSQIENKELIRVMNDIINAYKEKNP